MRLDGKHAVVTGAAAGIGLAIARSFLRAGATLTVADRDDAALALAARELQASNGAGVGCLVVDLGDHDAVAPALDRAAAVRGPITILVNNAGIGMQKPLFDHEVADFERIFAVNLFGLFVAMKHVARGLRERGIPGSIINLSSVAGVRGSVGRAAYGSSKAAVINLTQVAAVELATHGIRVNAIAPGPIETDLVRRMHTPGTRQGWLAETPMGRYGEPSDIAAGALYLASDESRFMTGHVLCIDGGFSAGGLVLPLERFTDSA